MKEYEIHVSANYRTEGDSEEGSYFTEYREAESEAQATAALEQELKEEGYYNITLDAIEA